MKKIILIIVFLIFSILIFNNFNNPIGYTILKQGENKEQSDHIISIEKISENAIIVDVDGISNIIQQNSEKEINGVVIKVNRIFYVEEVELRSVDLIINVIEIAFCGNGKCEDDEDKKNCCIDCGCEKGYKCKNNICEKNLDECQDNRDCDDNNPETIDLCTGDPKKCINKLPLECVQNEDCDDKNECTLDECKNNKCFNTLIIDCKQEEKSIKKELEIIKEKGFLGKLINKILSFFGL